MRKLFGALLLLATSLAISGNNAQWSNSGGSLSTQAKTVHAVAVPGGSLLFQDDFKSSSGTTYSWGTLPMTSLSTFVTQAGSNWQYNDDCCSNAQGGIIAWPADGTKNAWFMKYVLSDDLNVISHAFDPGHVSSGTLRPTEIYVQWKEYRSSTFDGGSTKDWRVNLFTAGHWGNTHDQPCDNPTNGDICGAGVDLYGGWGSSTSATDSTTTNAIDMTGMNIQGAGFSQAGDPNTIWGQSYTFTKATVHTIELHIKVNTPGNADGAAEMWIDGTKLTNSRTNVRFTPASKWDSAGLGQSYIDGFQLGMTASNNGFAFAGVSTRYITDFKISTSYIP